MLRCVQNLYKVFMRTLILPESPKHSANVRWVQSRGVAPRARAEAKPHRLGPQQTDLAS